MRWWCAGADQPAPVREIIMVKRENQLLFDAEIGKNKPVTLGNGGDGCPFCRRDQLEGIIAEDGPILLVVNKYPVLQDAFQTVLIETEDCHSELSLYPKTHLYRVIRFGVEQWQEMIQSGQFRSVLFFKNHGPYSGGTIRHPHMQIVGLRHIDYADMITSASFTGNIINRDTGVELNLANQPRIGFFEFNVRLANIAYLNKMADYIQIITHYILHHFHRNCNSYNLFFYQVEGEIVVKAMPRFVTSPLFVGYAIPQVSTRAKDVIQEIQSLYF
jgi:galactose-1-phosphate uridylyltransferase